MQSQWLVLAVFFLVLATDHFVFWRNFERATALDTTRARRTLWLQWMLMLWACAGLVLAFAAAHDLPLSALWLEPPTGPRLWVPLALTVGIVALQFQGWLKVARMQDKTPVRGQFGDAGRILPHTTSELPAWLLASLTAGFCEELLFRAFLVWIFQPFVGVWIAAAVALAVFVVAHAYQGAKGMIQCAVLGAILTAIMLLSHSLWPAVALHAAIDWMAGWTAWLVLREPVEPSPGRDAVQAR